MGIIVKYSALGYLIGEGFRNFFKNKKSTMASLIIMIATMFVFGIFFTIGENVNHIIADSALIRGRHVNITTILLYDKNGRELRRKKNLKIVEATYDNL